MELVIVIGIFAIISVYLLKMFMTADRLRGKAVATSKGLVRAESVAEYIKGSSEGTLADLKKAVCTEFGAVEENGVLVIRYNKSWDVTDKTGEFLLCVKLEENGSSGYKGNITVYSEKKDTEYCNLEITGLLGK